ncbi:MAG: hypothetical protein HY717_23400 [Planctomycetes bacterium]|nr:hypothetical protein [Planctomycetota bacterium]
MPTTIKALAEKRGEVGIKIQALAERCQDEKVPWTAIDETEWNSLNAEYDRFSREIRGLQVGEELAARLTPLPPKLPSRLFSDDGEEGTPKPKPGGGAVYRDLAGRELRSYTPGERLCPEG